MSLAEKTCVPCSGDSDSLNREEAENMLKQAPGWELSDDAAWLKKHVTFKNFKQSLAFVNKVGDIAEKHGHHPDITFGWGYCDIQLQTHKIGGLHENDFIVAADINQIQD